MSDTHTPTYAGPDGTYLDARPGPDYAQYGSVVLDVSGWRTTLDPLGVFHVIDLLSGPLTFGSSVTFTLGEDPETVLLSFCVEEHGINVRITAGEQVTHQVTIPPGDAPTSAARIRFAGTESRGWGRGGGS
ncbi:hypothetical protein [Nonomuraea sp. NPDC050202]|uniref:hypothetical protein n=1 Tax=Nonomuraea sp. NPDC050202 TaxID=3155035 RepID=UPI003402A913